MGGNLTAGGYISIVDVLATSETFSQKTFFLPFHISKQCFKKLVLSTLITIMCNVFVTYLEGG